MINGQKYRKSNNLFDYQQTQGITDNCFINQNGQIVSNADYYFSYPIYVAEGETYTWQFNRREIDGRHTAPTVGYYDANDNLISAAQHAATVINFVFTTPQNCAYIKCSVYKKNNLQTQAQLNVGSTLLPYEPYGNIWTDVPIPTRKYVNGAWVDISPKQYVNGEWV